MIFYNFEYYLSVLVIYYFIDHGAALNKESIVSGYIADHKYFQYQAVILGVANLSFMNEVVGGGAIVHEYFVISAAQNFINRTGQLKELKFTVAVGTSKLGQNSGFLANVDRIFVPPYNPFTTLNDIALVKLEQRLVLDKTKERFTKVNLPKTIKSLPRSIGFVSGFGTVFVKVSLNQYGFPERYGFTDNKLHFGVVEIMEDETCLLKYPDVTLNRQMCGFMYSREVENRPGICDKDIGNPLVINGTLEGIASRNNIDCNDTIDGCVYTKVAAFIDFINTILEGGLPHNTFVYTNRPHISQRIRFVK